MNILIIEDEMLAYRRLAKLVKEALPEAEISEPIETLAAAKKWFAENPAPFLTFCDIHLADGSAMELLEEEVITSPAVITTAYNQYALETFNTAAIAYLLKPVQKDELVKAVQKAIDLGIKLAPQKAADEQAQKTKPPAYRSRLMVRFADYLKLLMVEDVAYFYSENKGTYARTHAGKTYPVDQNLDKLQETLDPKKFFRLNRQYLICFQALGDMRTYTKGRVIVVLNPAAKEAQVVSSERAAEFKQWLGDEL